MNQSVDRALTILDELSRGPKRLGDLAATLGTHKSTALRLLHPLEERGYVRRRGEGPQFELGLRFVEMGSRVLDALDLRLVTRPYLERLAAATGETIHLAVLDGAEVVYVDKVESVHPVRMYSRVGLRAPSHCTGVGKVLLAFTPPERWPPLELRRYTPRTITEHADLLRERDRIMKQGWGSDEREHEESIRCVAAPVFQAHGEVLAAISISVPTSRMSASVLRTHVTFLREVADAVSAEMGSPGPSSHKSADD